MKINEGIILLIRQKQELKLNLALKLAVSESTINRQLAANKPNGLLTTKTAIKVISKGLGLREKEILAESVTCDSTI